jgi:hypothetical protein
MHYKVLVITTQTACCSETRLSAEVEHACNSMAQQGYVLVSAHPTSVSGVECCTYGMKPGSFLIFARPVDELTRG